MIRRDSEDEIARLPEPQTGRLTVYRAEIHSGSALIRQLAEQDFAVRDSASETVEADQASFGNSFL
jgi:uncharacterized protein YbjT (DUF2867 family)